MRLSIEYLDTIRKAFTEYKTGFEFCDIGSKKIN